MGSEVRGSAQAAKIRGRLFGDPLCGIFHPGEGCLQELGLLWDHRLNEVMLKGVHYKLRNLPTGRVSIRPIMLQQDVVLLALCQADLTAQWCTSRQKGRGPPPLVRSVPGDGRQDPRPQSGMAPPGPELNRDTPAVGSRTGPWGPRVRFGARISFT